MDVNTMMAPKFRVGQVLKVYKMMTKIMAYLMTAMASKLKVVEKRLTPHIHTVALPMSKLHMMKEVVTSEPCMLAMMQCQLRNMMIDMEKEVDAMPSMQTPHKYKFQSITWFTNRVVVSPTARLLQM